MQQVGSHQPISGMWRQISACVALKFLLSITGHRRLANSLRFLTAVPIAVSLINSCSLTPNTEPDQGVKCSTKPFLRSRRSRWFWNMYMQRSAAALLDRRRAPRLLREAAWLPLPLRQRLRCLPCRRGMRNRWRPRWRGLVHVPVLRRASPGASIAF